MPKFNYSHNNFINGEIGPKSIGDVSREQYYNSVRELENMIPRVQGGLERRPGSRFSRELPTQNGVRLIEFIFSKTEAFLIAIDDDASTSSYQFYVTKNDDTDVPITFNGDAAPGFNDVDGAGVLDKDGLHWVQQGDIIFFTHSSSKMRPFFISRVGDAFQLNEWGDGRITSLRDFQIENTGFGTCSPAQIVGELLPGFPNDALTYPYTDPNVDPAFAVVIEAGTGTNFNLSFRAESVNSRIFEIFNSDYLGELFKVTVGATSYIFRINGLENFSGVSVCGPDLPFIATAELLADGTGATELTSLLSSSPGNRISSDNWQEQAWSTRRGWPRAITLHEQRLVMAGTITEPDNVWHSNLGNLFRFKARHLPQDNLSDVSGLNFVGEVLITDPFTYPVSTTTVDRISWLSSGDNLRVGTLGAEYIVRGFDDQALSAQSISIRRQTRHGSSPVRPEDVGDATYFVSADGKKVREFAISPQTRRFQARDITQHNDTITNHLLAAEQTPDYERLYNFEVIDQRYTESRQTLFMIVRPTRALISVTLSDAGRIQAWARHNIGGDFNGGPVRVDGIASMPAPDGTFDEVWIAVRRTDSSGTPITTLEKMSRSFEHIRFNNQASGLPSDIEDAPIFYDQALFLTSPTPTNTFTYRASAEGKTIGVLVDGYQHTDVLVGAGGVITLDRDATEVVAGFKQKYRVKTLPTETGLATGQSTGADKRINEVTIRLYKSFLGMVGAEEDCLYPIPYDNYTQANETFNPMPFTGNITVNLDDVYDIDSSVILEGDHGLPFSILNLTLQGSTND